MLHELIERGRDAIEETLDLLCFVRNEPTELKPESGDMFVLSTENGRCVFTDRTGASVGSAGGKPLDYRHRCQRERAPSNKN